MRKLATIRKIDEFKPIENADAIEAALIDGWSVVVKKGEYKENDMVVFFEIDSVLPEYPEFEFMRPRNFRVKTIKLRGQISQGLVMPLSILTAGKQIMGFPTPNLGDDVTELLGVIKFEPKVHPSLGGKVKGNFPSFLHKTDEERVQNIKKILRDNAGEWCYITEKLDGSSATFYLKGDEFGVCSRNLDLKETEDNLFWKTARELNLEEKLRKAKEILGFDLAIQGELIGPNVQQNKYGLKENDFRAFNLFNIEEQKFANFNGFLYVMNQIGVDTVPILDTLYELEDNVDALVKKSIGQSMLNEGVKREGVVIRPIVEKELDRFGRFSFKSINPEFLLKFQEA